MQKDVFPGQAASFLETAISHVFIRAWVSGFYLSIRPIRSWLCLTEKELAKIRAHTPRPKTRQNTAKPPCFLQMAKTSGPKLIEFWPSHSVLGHAKSPCFCHMAKCKRESGPKFGDLWPKLISTSLGQASGHIKPRNFFNPPWNPGWPKFKLLATPCVITACGDKSRMAKSRRSVSRKVSP